MKLKSLVLAAALLPAFGSAFAATYTIDLTEGANDKLSAFLGATHLGPGAFSDTFVFTNYTAAAANVSANLISTSVSFDSLSLNGVNSPTVGPLGFFNIAAILGQSTTGPLTLVVTGNVIGSVGSYGGDFNVSPVPEPATYGMLAGGLGILAFAARRRKQK